MRILSVKKTETCSRMIELKITFDGKNVSVNGPISDKILCLGLIELAKDVIKDFNPEDQPRVVVPEIRVPS